MFLLVSGRHVGAHVGAHVGGHQHGVSIQISINLGKTFLRISSIRKIVVTRILARDFVYISSFYFQVLDIIYWTVLIFYFDLFWIAWHWKPAIFIEPRILMAFFRNLIVQLLINGVFDSIAFSRDLFLLSAKQSVVYTLLYLTASVDAAEMIFV